MNLFIDCEWNEFGGELISMALTSEDGRDWYEVLPCNAPGRWVAENVMPKLGKAPVSNVYFTHSLAAYLAQFDSIHIVADWPEDISRFCDALIIGAGMRVNTPPLTMEIVRVDSVSSNPHNALADARGLREALAA